MPGNNGIGGDMKNIKTSELQDQQLVDKVAEAQGWSICRRMSERYAPMEEWWWCNGQKKIMPRNEYNPLTNAAQAMGILDKMQEVSFYKNTVRYYPGKFGEEITMHEGTRRENLLRCFVASKLGDTVTVEEAWYE